MRYIDRFPAAGEIVTLAAARGKQARRRRIARGTALRERDVSSWQPPSARLQK
jgi:hypothetical protein